MAPPERQADHLEICGRRCAGLAGLGHVAVDGAKHKAMSYARVAEAEVERAKNVAEWLARTQREDAFEDGEHGDDRHGDEPAGWMREICHKRRGRAGRRSTGGTYRMDGCLLYGIVSPFVSQDGGEAKCLSGVMPIAPKVRTTGLTGGNRSFDVSL